MKRWPVQPLLRLCEVRLASSVDDHAPEWHAPDTEIARLLGVNVRSVIEWRQTGLSFVQCDRYATRLELHPVEVWPDYDDFMDEEVDDLDIMPELPRCADPDCPNPVVPSKGHPSKKWCSARCRLRAKDRRRRAKPEVREKRYARSRAYYAECGDAVRAKQRARDRANREARSEYKKAYYLANAEVLKAKQRERSARKRAEAA